MTFSGEEVRLRYHQLPTETQVSYEHWEHRLAKRGCRLHIEAVLTVDKHSEVVVRISENFQFPATAAADVTDTD
jgi:hypothetical protein